MSQFCKVCSEPAAGFHFGAFTCEGCKVSAAARAACVTDEGYLFKKNIYCFI